MGALDDLIVQDREWTVDDVRDATTATVHELRHDRRVVAERDHEAVQRQAVDLYWGTRTFRNFNVYTRRPTTTTVETLRQQIAGGLPAVQFEINNACDERDTHIREMVELTADKGGQFRWMDLPFRLHLYDDRVALLSLDFDDTTVGAWRITHSGFIQQLIALHTRMWQAAIPRPRARSRRLDVELTAILRELVVGRPDQAAAARLGMSLRSYRRRVSDLLEALGAPSRFAAGAAAQRLGYLDLVVPPSPRQHG